MWMEDDNENNKNNMTIMKHKFKKILTAGRDCMLRTLGTAKGAADLDLYRP